jgi:hypothetical protein
MKLEKIILPTLLVVFVAWQSDEINREEKIATTSYGFDLPPSNISYSNISLYQGHLRFSSHQDVIETIDDLEIQYNSWNDSFLNYYQGIGEDSLDAIEDSIQFDDEYPAVVFENYYGFTSLRKVLHDSEEWYSENDTFELGIDPDEHFIMDDEYRTVLNAKAQLIVGDTVFKLYDDMYISVHSGGTLDSSLAVVGQINSGELNIYTLSGPQKQTLGIIIYSWGTPNPPVGCTPESMKKAKGKETDGTRRIKWRLRISNYAWGKNAVAKIKNQKKKKNRWKKYRTDCSVRCWGAMVDTFCVDHVFDNTESKKRRKLKSVGVYNGYAASLPGKVKGDFNGAGGIQKSHTVVW